MDRNLIQDLTEVVEVEIASGASLSAGLFLGGMRLVGIEMPSTWTAANITFEASPDGVTYNKLYDQDGTEVIVTAATDRFITVFATYLAGTRYLKVRSGTSGTPVNQAADRTLRLILMVP